MKRIKAKPYKLFNKIQNYEWGTKNENAFIPKFLGIEPEKDLPYGELWIGAHPKAPSEIELDGEKIPLNLVIEKHSVEFLGKDVAEKFGNKLPFLLKVLSAAQALSIQLHPNKKQAEELHMKDPQNYPDDNHKPEIAIAVDSLTALAGFRPVEQIKQNLVKYSELSDFIGVSQYDEVIHCKNDNDIKEGVKSLYAQIMNQSGNKEKLDCVIQKLVARISSQYELTQEEIQFLKQHKLYGSDVGLLSIFFFNLIQLERGQAIFTDAGIPHAYIVGNIIECMANSDNVVRAGLTPKFKDVNTLLKIMVYDFSEFDIINKEKKEDEVVFKTGANEFEVCAYSKGTGFESYISTNTKPVVILVENGNLNITWIENGSELSEEFVKGESLIIPALLSEFKLSVIGDTIFYIVRVPE